MLRALALSDIPVVSGATLPSGTPQNEQPPAMGADLRREMLASVLPVHGPPAPRGECSGCGGCENTFSPDARLRWQVTVDVQWLRHGTLRDCSSGASMGPAGWCAPCHRSLDARRASTCHPDMTCQFRTNKVTSITGVSPHVGASQD